MPLPTVPHQRVQRGVASTLRWENVDEDGDLVAAAATVTVAVAKADGTEVVAAGTATTNPSPGLYTYALGAVATLETLTATWTVAGGASHRTVVEVCGGFLCSVAELRAAETSLADPTKYPAATLAQARLETEAECEWICDVAFVPRHRRVAVDGDGTSDLAIPDPHVRQVRSVRIYSAPDSYRAFTAAELAALQIRSRMIVRSDGAIFDGGVGNVVVEYEHGYDRPPQDLKRQFMQRTRWWVNQVRSGIPDRATRFTVADGGTYALDTANPYKTGMPDVDAAYGRYSLRASAAGSGVAPASRALNTDPSRGSLFHGGVR
ncbi:MAG: hypothetical protein AB7L84_09830 [Acidimicrobiia bacterium]